MGTKEIAQGLVDLCKEGKFDEAGERYYSSDIVSLEPHGDPAEVRGIDAVKAKSEWWSENFEVNNADVVGPFINGDQFAVMFNLDTTNKKSGEHAKLEEVAIYTVRDGKIVHERFLYNG